MSTLKLPPARRAELRADAHALKPVVLIGDSGLTPAVLQEIDRNLAAHTLIKIRIFSDDRAVRAEINEAICTQLRAAPVQIIGKLLVLYRFGEALLKDDKTLPEHLTQNKKIKQAGPRNIVIRKPSTNPGRRPKAQKIRLLGNERVTSGGIVKRARVRKVSLKKRAAD